jgi:hypothetical protein
LYGVLSMHTGVLFALPFSIATAMPVNQDYAVVFDLHLNPRHYFGVAPPLPAAPVAAPQYSSARPASHIVAPREDASADDFNAPVAAGDFSHGKEAVRISRAQIRLTSWASR